MNKKQKISWGVSFGSIALVAGMVSYLGLSNGNTNNKQMDTNQGISANRNSDGQSLDNFNNDKGQELFDGDSSSAFNQDGQGPSIDF
ncbi:hypothetical protein [Neobacillus mesonae]|uniref:Uncharacterized protein n=1 Tax=Neobacillus mesonae TaxID=1193713 RepID=A0A3T0I2W6_9BACI|nr:hypothetical protein [Neobacillus mesonae]AZU63663.1 hypothetical protein CHR53_21635 [Neobacillus mesonae]